MLSLPAVASMAAAAAAADVRHFSFAYDQPHTTAYGIAGDTFADKLNELSHGTMVIDQFPGAQLGQEPQVLQKLRTGDVDFSMTSTANAATLQPESGVFSIHFVFRSEDHLLKALSDPGVIKAFKEMINGKVEGARILTLGTMGFRDMYGKKEVHNVDDLGNVKVRVQATATEDTMFPAYGAQTVHMPFGDVYTALQTGIVAMAENGINVYQSNKHYEVAPIMSLTQHEANNNVLWVSDKVWNSLSDEQKGWVQTAADEVGKVEPPKALGLENDSMAKLEKMGVKFVKDVDKSGFIKDAQPIQDQLAEKLGPGAVNVLRLVRDVK
ncbi:MAG: TRAP transporter substrate-binding protein [Alphaproteobacteria bacterium]|nr:TRAP transporter substrate-binding protein [Alphaproteobacteria bacterium]